MSLESRPTADASIGELMTQLSSLTSRLVRDELRLAQKEFHEPPSTPVSVPASSALPGCWPSSGSRR